MEEEEEKKRRIEEEERGRRGEEAGRGRGRRTEKEDYNSNPPSVSTEAEATHLSWEGACLAIRRIPLLPGPPPHTHWGKHLCSSISLSVSVWRAFPRVKKLTQ